MIHYDHVMTLAKKKNILSKLPKRHLLSMCILCKIKATKTMTKSQVIAKLLKKEKCKVIKHYLQGTLSRCQLKRLLKLTKPQLIHLSNELGVYINPGKTKSEIVDHINFKKESVRKLYFRYYHGEIFALILNLNESIKDRKFNRETRQAITKLKQKNSHD